MQSIKCLDKDVNGESAEAVVGEIEAAGGSAVAHVGGLAGQPPPRAVTVTRSAMPSDHGASAHGSHAGRE